MTVSTALSKTATWAIRLIQLFFAIILMGVTAYMVHEFREYSWSVPHEVSLPLAASVLATFICIFSIMAVCFLGHTLQLVAAFLDFTAFVLYIASVALLRHNFHAHSERNPLRNALIAVRASNYESLREDRSSALVKLLVGGVVIQIVLFFFTTLLGVFVARRSDDRTRTVHRV